MDIEINDAGSPLYAYIDGKYYITLRDGRSGRQEISLTYRQVRALADFLSESAPVLENNLQKKRGR